MAYLLLINDGCTVDFSKYPLNKNYGAFCYRYNKGKVVVPNSLASLVSEQGTLNVAEVESDGVAGTVTPKPMVYPIKLKDNNVPMTSGTLRVADKEGNIIKTDISFVILVKVFTKDTPDLEIPNNLVDKFTEFLNRLEHVNISKELKLFYFNSSRNEIVETEF